MEKYNLSKLFTKKFISQDFKTLLNQVTKKDIVSSLNILTGDNYNNPKSELIDFIYSVYYMFFIQYITSFSSEMINFLKLIIKNNGILEFTDDMDPNLVIIFMIHLLAFPVIKDQKYTVVIANEVLERIKNYNYDNIQDQIKLNDLVVTYTRSLVDVYGRFESDLIVNYLKEYEKINIDMYKYYQLVNNDGFIYDYLFEDNYITHYKVEEINNFYETRKKYKSLDYYHLSKKEILEGIEITTYEKDLLDFLMNDLYMTKEMAHQGLYYIKEAVILDMPLDEIKKFYSLLDISQYEHKKLDMLIENIYNNTRLWTLKGYTRNEIKIPKLIKFPNAKKIR